MIIELDDKYYAYIGSNKTFVIFNRKAQFDELSLSREAFEKLLDNLPEMLKQHQDYITMLTQQTQTNAPVACFECGDYEWQHGVGKNHPYSPSVSFVDNFNKETINSIEIVFTAALGVSFNKAVRECRELSRKEHRDVSLIFNGEKVIVKQGDFDTILHEAKGKE